MGYIDECGHPSILHHLLSGTNHLIMSSTIKVLLMSVLEQLKFMTAAKKRHQV